MSDFLIWSGALVSLGGLCGLVWCILYIARARRAKLPDDVLRERLQRAVPLNLGALFLSVIGLMLVILGIFLA
ncbi:MAG: hypothetical protein AAGF27_07745 [Pseudomonadota bacterium]